MMEIAYLKQREKPCWAVKFCMHFKMRKKKGNIGCWLLSFFKILPVLRQGEETRKGDHEQDQAERLFSHLKWESLRSQQAIEGKGMRGSLVCYLITKLKWEGQPTKFKIRGQRHHQCVLWLKLTRWKRDRAMSCFLTVEFIRRSSLASLLIVLR